MYSPPSFAVASCFSPGLDISISPVPFRLPFSSYKTTFHDKETLPWPCKACKAPFWLGCSSPFLVPLFSSFSFPLSGFVSSVRTQAFLGLLSFRFPTFSLINSGVLLTLSTPSLQPILLGVRGYDPLVFLPPV